jgi:quinol monooxygenase YgiN
MRLRIKPRQNMPAGQSAICPSFPQAHVTTHMNFFKITIAVLPLLSFSDTALPEEPGMPYVRIAELEIDPAQLDSYHVAVKEEIGTSVRTEPGVLAIYAVAEKDSPTRLRFFEMYADEAAYHAHIGSPHFRKYVAITKSMITSRKLIDTVPIQLSAKR